MSDRVGVPEFASYRSHSVEALRALCTRTTTLMRRCIPLAALLLLAGCARETLFQSNFDATPINQPPAHVQEVGTANIDGPPGSVIVVSPPVTPSGKWLQISRPTADSGIPGFQGVVSEFRGEGEYNFSATVLMPPSSGVATIQFEAFSQPVSFLHIDFMPDNRVRIDDVESTRFGTFPRGQPFIVQVTLNLNESPNAHIVLGGAGASGSADRNIIPGLHSVARQFGAVRLWMGFPHTGAFDATNIVVTRETD